MTRPYDTPMSLPQQDGNQSVVAAQNSSPSSRDTSEYWVTRVVRQMKGCSPARIDSVIQANLPPVKIRWSQRLDTLEIPGLKGRQAYSVDCLPKCYELGYFRENPLLHPEIAVHTRGIVPEVQYYQLKNDSVIGSILLVCFVVMSVIVHKAYGFLGRQAKEFVYPSPKKESSIDAATGSGTASLLLSYILLATIGSVVFFYHTQGTHNIMLCQIEPYWLLGIYFAAFILFFIVKLALSSFINWVFFDKTKRQMWRQSYDFLLIAESILVLLTSMTCMYLNQPSEICLLLSFIIIIIIKLALLFSTYIIFLPKFYCILHLLSYLCALEIIPLLALWVLLTGITDNLILIF